MGKEERALLTVLAGLVSAFASFWIAASLSGLIANGSWAHVDFGAALKGFIGIFSHGSEPARGFPRGGRRELGGPTAFYTATAIVVMVPAAAGALIATKTERGRQFVSRLGRRREAIEGAEWAQRRDLLDLLVDGPEEGRVILGSWPNRGGRGPQLLATERLQSVLVVAPQRAGKTTGLGIPAVLEHQGPVISTSIRSDVLDATIARRRELGEAMVFDPTRATAVRSMTWSPLGSSRTWHGAQRMAFWLCSSARGGGGGGMADPDFWFKASAKALAPHLLAAARSDGGFELLLRWIETQEEREVRAILTELGERPALQSLDATLGREERQRSSIYTTIETILDAYSDPRVLESARSSEISPARLLDGGCHSLYLCGPPHEQERLAPLFGALLEELVALAYESVTESGRPLDPPLLIVGDELANIAPIRSLPTIASTGAGTGIQLISIFQDLAQIQSRWGREDWRTVANNHRARIFGTGNGDPETLDYVRRLTGEAEFEQSSQTQNNDPGLDFRHRHSRTDSATMRALTPANVVRETAADSAVLVYGNKPAAKVKLRPYYRDPRLRELAGLEPEGRAEKAKRAGRDRVQRGARSRARRDKDDSDSQRPGERSAGADPTHQVPPPPSV